MAFLSKAESLKLAAQLGIEGAEDMPWKELQAAIAARQKLDSKLPYKMEKPGTNKVLEMEPEKIKQPRKSIQEQLNDQYRGRPVMIAPELKPERYRLLKYDEDLGTGIEVEERRFDMNQNDEVFDISGQDVNYNQQAANSDISHDYTSGTYRIKGSTGRHVIAKSSVPKENYGCGITALVDYVPIVSWNGRNGYLWTHPTYMNVKTLLKQSGYYAEYKDRFKNEPNIWYVAGKTLACNIDLVHHIFREIEEKEKRKAEEYDAYMRNLRSK